MSGHLRFIGGEVRCMNVSRRVKLGDDHAYADGFTCPACGERVPSLAERDAAYRRPGYAIVNKRA